jgi:ribonuclease G
MLFALDLLLFLFDILYSLLKVWIKIYNVNKELIIRSSSDFVDFALLKDGKLIELHKEEEEKSNFQVGDILSPKYENQLPVLMLLL